MVVDDSVTEAPGIALLGATGSVGDNALRVLRRHPGNFRLVALSAKSDVAAMLALCREFVPQRVCMTDRTAARKLRQALSAEHLPVAVIDGQQGLCELASLPDISIVIAAVVGIAGLESILSAAESGKRILLANKEALVCGGRLVMDAVIRGGGELLPLDSEHSAVFRCLGGRQVPDTVRRIVLTASGGPLLKTPLAEFDEVTPEQACAHPKWKMGAKISVDSATMINKGLELIEACCLFEVAESRVDVVVHSQALVHGLVEYCDGSMQLQLADPDMRLPIGQALYWPQYVDIGVAALNWQAMSRLEFEAPDLNRFPGLGLARQALISGGEAPLALNIANEVAVAAFLQQRIKFTSIVAVVEGTLATAGSLAPDTPESLMHRADRFAAFAGQLAESLA